MKRLAPDSNRRPQRLEARTLTTTPPSPLISNWKKFLNNYWDKQLIDLLTFGFPLDFDRSLPLNTTLENHKSALQYSNQVQEYLETEIRHGAILGPFRDLPFKIHVSPLMTRPKQDSNKCRTILDLSWPKGASVNAGVTSDRYLGTYFKLTYPSIDNITQKLKELGPGAMIFKIDISRAFRHIRIDPKDIDLLGIQHNDAYIDASLAFGFKHGSTFFQQCSDAIRHIMTQHGFPHLWNYIDDLIYTGLPSQIYPAYQFLLNLLPQLGLDISQEKLVPPTTVATCLGIRIDTTARTISIPTEKLNDILYLCQSWTSKSSCTKNQLQSLLGSLLYITKCVRPARYFLNRMLALLRDSYDKNIIKLTQQFGQDLNWFLTFLEIYNGVTYYDTRKVHDTIFLDASLSGLGGCFNQMITPYAFHGVIRITISIT